MARRLEVQIIGDASSLERAFGRASGSTATFGTRLRSFGKAALIGGAAAGALAVVVGKKLVEAAISAQEANDKLTKAFENQGLVMTATSPAVLGLEKSARALGFANTDTREGLLKLINAGKSYKQSVSEMEVAQNLARVSGQSLGDSVTSLIRLQTGNVRAAKQYGIVLAPLTTAQDALKRSGIDLTTALGKQELAHAKIQDKLATGAAYYDALSAKVKGQAQVFSESAAGGIARFHAALGNIEETLGAKLLPAFTAAISGLDNFLNWITGAGSATDKFKQALETLGLSSEQVGKVMDAVGKTFSAIKEIFQSTVVAVTAIWDTFGSTLVASLKNELGFLITSIRNFFQIFKGIFEVIHGLLTGDWSQLWQGLKDIFGGISAQILAALRFWWEEIKILFDVGWKLVTALTTAAWAAIKALLTAAWDGLKALATLIFNAIKAVIELAWNTVKTLTLAVWTAITTLTTTAWNAIRTIVTAAANAVRAVVSAGMSAARSAVTAAWSAAQTATSSAWNAMRAAVSGAIGAILGIIRSFVSAITGLIQSLIGIFRSAGSAAVRAFGEGALSALESAYRAVRSVVDKIKSAVSDAASAAAGAVGGGIPFIPGRQHGGPVRGGSAYIVGESGPELFVPALSGRIEPRTSAASALAAGGGTVVYVTVQGALLGSSVPEVANTIRRELLRTSSRNVNLGLA